MTATATSAFCKTSGVAVVGPVTITSDPNNADSSPDGLLALGELANVEVEPTFEQDHGNGKADHLGSAVPKVSGLITPAMSGPGERPRPAAGRCPECAGCTPTTAQVAAASVNAAAVAASRSTLFGAELLGDLPR